MSHDVEISCRCRQIHGWLRGASPQTVHRIICYCDDCQAALHHLGRVDLIDAHGGSDAIQVSPASVSFDRGTERIVGLRLSPKGRYRWYASCCCTPLCNTVSRPVPVLPMSTSLVLADAARRDELFGTPRGAFGGKYAIGGVADGLPNLGHGARWNYLLMVLGWNRGGTKWKAWPNPFFDPTTRALKYPLLKTLSNEERDALRPLCGPNPKTPK